MKSSSSPLPLIISGVVVLLGLAMLGVAAAAILRPGASSAEPTGVPAGTHVIIPTATIAPTSTATPTSTPMTPTATSTPETPSVTETATIALPATTAPQSTQRPQATQPPSPTDTPVPPASARILNPSFAVETTTIGVNQKIWFTFSVTNASTTAPLPIGELGAVVFNSAGQNIFFQESWSGFELTPGQVLNHRDGVPGIGTPGTYTMRLTICYSSKPDCVAGGNWELLAQPVTITVQ